MGFKARGYSYLYPARGWKPHLNELHDLTHEVTVTFTPQGDGNWYVPSTPYLRAAVTVTFTPQGDGNFQQNEILSITSMLQLPLPRKGMETQDHT
ncbi:hypothetical protein H6G33_21740 [Calothrix sp. FACHB-1219]|uniref:hypothetical protein n=1 Tax=unclassified Calothrix TaxID=2619626 RepID=UPI001687E894|nr:hypothetical protein [Calothrix sp. FACHB-1219]MBD2219644.1 hypothetical protein [Calothrix sp. FACHB-1219]